MTQNSPSDQSRSSKEPNLRVAVITPLNLEFMAVSRLLRNVDRHISDSGLQYEVGQLAFGDVTCDVAVALAGQGPDIAGAHTSEMIGLFSPRMVFLVGIAGSVKDAKVGDVVLGNVIYDYTRSKEEKTGEVSIRPCNTHRVKNWIEQAMGAVARDYARSRESRREKSSFRVFSGAIASGGTLMADIGGKTLASLRTNYSDTLAVEMEAAGFMNSSRSRDIPAVVIRGISDKISDKNRSGSEKYQMLAADNAARVFCTLLENICSNRLLRKIYPDVEFIDWLYASNLLYEMQKKIEAKFPPALVITSAGAGSMAALFCLGNRVRLAPTMVSVTFPKNRSTSDELSLFEAAADQSDCWKRLETSKWIVYISKILERYDRNANVLIFDDRVVSGDTHEIIKEYLNGLGFINVKSAAMIGGSEEGSAGLDFVGTRINGDFLLPWGPREGRYYA